jgi:hypothetical protein
MRVTAQHCFTKPPLWAILERQLIDLMNQSAEPLLQKYVHSDGSIMWPPHDDFSSIDGLDDAYESFHNWPLFYALGGDEKFRQLSQFEFEAITRQFTRYDCGHGHPMVVKEYEQGYDWFHQGEGYLFFYMLGLSDPANTANIERARRFAGFYLNEDPQAPNYDEALKLVRCAFVGSMGPAHRNFDATEWGWADWKRHYGLPYQDVPGVTSLQSIKDRGNALSMGETMRARMSKGDVATNLAIIGLMTNAYLYTQEEKYKAWVKDYLQAWIARTQENGGLLPDNLGLSGKIGENMNGKWYGGYYGWTWPHGWGSLGDAVVLAAENAVLLYHDPAYLDFPRSQLDRLAGHGVEVNRTLYIPHKYGDPGWYRYAQWVGDTLTVNLGLSQDFPDQPLLWKEGWFEFQPLHPKFLGHLWFMSLAPQDLERLRRTRNYQNHNWERILDRYEKNQGGNEAAWVSYLNGEYPGYPEQILQHNLSQVYRRLAFLRQDTQDPKTYGDYYLQVRNPITVEGLAQLTMGSPLPVYNGGHLMATIRVFDRSLLRPGLPQEVGALVQEIHADRTVIKLVNLSAVHTRELVLQAGAYGEHQFTDLKEITESQGEGRGDPQIVGSNWFELDLPPGAEITLEIGLKRFVNDPAFAFPWNRV